MNDLDNTHFKTYDKLKHTLNIPKKQLLEELKKKFHDRHLKQSHKRIYMNRIYDPVIGCYFHDLLQQTGDRPDGYPAYFHVFIESNRRYAFAYPVDDKK